MPDDLSPQARYMHEITSAVVTKIDRLPTDESCLVVIATVEAIAGLTSKDARSRAAADGHDASYAHHRIADYIKLFANAANWAINASRCSWDHETSYMDAVFDVDEWIKEVRHTVISQLSRLPRDDRDLVMIASIEAVAKIAAMEASKHSQDNGFSGEVTRSRINDYARIFAESSRPKKPEQWVRF